MLDIIFCSVPYSDLDHIYSAPAILKGVVQDNGFTAMTAEFGCTLLELCDKDVDLFHQTQKYFLSNADLSAPQTVLIEKFYSRIIDFFKQNPSHYIGLSAISFYSHRALYEICTRIRGAGITSKIVLGGQGSNVPFWKIFHQRYNIKFLESTLTFGNLMVQKKLADVYLQGDGEDAVINLLTNNSIEPVFHLSDTFRSPIPDYSDYQFDSYLLDKDSIAWPVTGSKGCVRDCDFCDVRKLFGKYRYRSGEDIANEMIAVSAQTGTRKFMFTDSLVNGGLKTFRDFLEIMSKYNIENPEKRIRWTGQYICRPNTPEDIYSLIASSGGEGLTIGAESGSNKVLEAMNKKSSVEALYRELELFRKNNITTVLLLMVGHWSETWEDFVDHCKMLVKITPYVRSSTISAVQLGSPMQIVPGTPSYINSGKNNIVLSDFDPGKIWFCKDNPGNTFRERVYRQVLSIRVAQRLRIPIVNQYEHYVNSISTLEDNSEQINKFYQQFF
jgi:hypothetical protein